MARLQSFFQTAPQTSPGRAATYPSYFGNLRAGPQSTWPLTHGHHVLLFNSCGSNVTGPQDLEFRF